MTNIIYIQDNKKKLYKRRIKESQEKKIPGRRVVSQTEPPLKLKLPQKLGLSPKIAPEPRFFFFFFLWSKYMVSLFPISFSSPPSSFLLFFSSFLLFFFSPSSSSLFSFLSFLLFSPSYFSPPPPFGSPLLFSSPIYSIFSFFLSYLFIYFSHLFFHLLLFIICSFVFFFFKI